ncbi:MAG: HPP family protein [Gammaproteobacteria bacterium]|nr:HPP family protein [Gammaproteobacteria bacterium]
MFISIKTRCPNTRKNLIWQPLFCTLYMTVILIGMQFVSGHSSMMWAVGATSLASSAFNVFSMPHTAVSQPWRILTAYSVASFVGVLLHTFMIFLFLILIRHHIFFVDPHYFWVMASLAVGLSLMLMVLMDAQHPPASGIALAMVLSVRDQYTFLAIWGSVFLLVFLRYVLRNQLRNLVD